MNLLADLRTRLPQTPQAVALRDDVDMNLSDDASSAPPVKASVLLPIILRREPTLLFTRRTATLARHSGQVSFPGGRSEPHDISPLETALRETFEETGIAPGLVSVAGYLGRHLTGTGFDIQPVVGVLADGFAWNGKTYPSLSKIAQSITGTRWNGPRFFGLRDKPSKEASA